MCFEVVNNKVGSQGCKYLKEASWKKLTAIDLGKVVTETGKNNIRDEGCLWLIKTDWKHLDYIDLCKKYPSQMTITSPTRGAKS